MKNAINFAVMVIVALAFLSVLDWDMRVTVAAVLAALAAGAACDTLWGD